MKKCTFVFYFLLICLNINAQINLVRNPSFEQYSRCPTGPDQIRNALYWSQIDTMGYSDTIWFDPLCSPEYCNSCSNPNGFIGVPQGGKYYHYSRTGNGMAEMMVYYDNNWSGGVESYQRDYVQGRFYSQLIAGKTYCVTFYVTLEQGSQYAINHLGAYIDNGAIDAGQDSVGCASPQTAFVPQIVEDSIINDTLNWVKVQGSYTATGNEKFITIGNFFDIEHTDTITRNLSGTRWYNGPGNVAWYLLDDVSVIAADAVANAGHGGITSPTGDSIQIGDTTGYLPCYWYACHGAHGSTGWVLIDSNTAGFKVRPDTTTRYVMVLDVCGNVSSDTAVVWVWPANVLMWKYANVLIYPNPAAGQLIVEGAVNCEVTLYNSIGQSFYKITMAESKEFIDIHLLNKGLYFIEITEPETGVRIVKKVIKE
jgi:hypothetical protein